MAMLKEIYPRALKECPNPHVHTEKPIVCTWIQPFIHSNVHWRKMQRNIFIDEKEQAYSQRQIKEGRCSPWVIHTEEYSIQLPAAELQPRPDVEIITWRNEGVEISAERWNQDVWGKSLAWVKCSGEKYIRLHTEWRIETPIKITFYIDTSIYTYITANYMANFNHRGTGMNFFLFSHLLTLMIVQTKFPLF